jgi:hypothetical protein
MIRRLADRSGDVERLIYWFDTHLTPPRCLRILPTREVVFASKQIRPEATTMRRCSKPVGMIWRGLWRRAMRVPADVRRASSWTSSVQLPATRVSTPWCS